MASTADFRNGLCIEFNHDIYQIVEVCDHIKESAVIQNKE